jgi:ATP-dependent Zn protease
MISVALAGRIAEELMFDGRVTTGASDDIKKVTQLATGLVTVYGMSPKMGLVGYNSMSGGEEQFSKPYSEKTNADIDKVVREVVNECYQRTKAVLAEKKHLIEA